jgi:hypothetical protein
MNTYVNRGGGNDTHYNCNIRQLDPNLLMLMACRGAGVLSHYADATWWEWTRGSALVFWGWELCAHLALNRYPPYLLSDPPIAKRPSVTPPIEKWLLIASKIKEIVDRGYLVKGPVKSLIEFFAVPKADDIRLVYNGRSCGLNQCTWAPNFWLSTTKTAIR